MIKYLLLFEVVIYDINIIDIKITIMLYVVIIWFYLYMIKYESLYVY